MDILKTLKNSTPAKNAFTVVLGFITLAALGYMIYRQKDVLLNYTWEFRPLPLIGTFLFYLLTLAESAWVWGWIMNAVARPFPQRVHFKNYMMSHVARRLPGTVWYIAGRAYFYNQAGIDARVTSLGSGLEYAVILASGVVTSTLFAASLIADLSLNPWIMVIVFVASLSILYPPVMQRIFRLARIESQPVPNRKIFLWVAAYVVIWITGGVTLFCTANIVYPLPISDLGYVIGSYSLVGLGSMLLLLAPSTVGVTEVGLSLLLSRIMPSSIAPIVAILSRALLTLEEILLAGMIYSWQRLRDHRENGH